MAFAACSFPEHEFIPPDDFERLKNGSTGGSGLTGGTGGFGNFGGVDAGSGGTGLTGGSGGTGGASGGTDAGSGGATGGSGGATGGTGGGTASCAGRCGQSGPVPGSNPACYRDSSCVGFANCCSDYGALCGTGGTGGATGGTGGATGGTGGATGGTGGATGGTGGASGGTGGGSGCGTVLINEVASTGPAGGFDEYVELHNYGTCTASLTGWVLKYSSSSGASQDDKWTGGATDSLGPGGYFVIAGANFPGTKNASLSGAGLGDDGGVGLFDTKATKIDSVAYGSVQLTHPFIETTAFPDSPTSTKSASRSPNATDTNDNSKDFARVNRSPGAAN